MRHKIKTDRFGRFSSFRKATIKSLAVSVLVNQRIVTTKVKAKSSRSLVEKLITLGKKNTLFARRQAFSLICDHLLVKKLFDVIAPTFANRVGGYTRIIPYRRQKGDNAQLVVLELTETYKKEKVKKLKEEKKVEPVQAVEKEEAKVKKAPTPQPKIGERGKVDKSVKQERPEPVEEKLAKPEVEEKKEEAPKPEKQAPLKIKPEKKPESKKPKKLFGGFKGIFKRSDSR